MRLNGREFNKRLTHVSVDLHRCSGSISIGGRESLVTNRNESIIVNVIVDVLARIVEIVDCNVFCVLLSGRESYKS